MTETALQQAQNTASAPVLSVVEGPRLDLPLSQNWLYYFRSQTDRERGKNEIRRLGARGIGGVEQIPGLPVHPEGGARGPADQAQKGWGDVLDPMALS
jgi:hypothetical protein